MLRPFFGAGFFSRLAFSTSSCVGNVVNTTALPLFTKASVILRGLGGVSEFGSGRGGGGCCPAGARHSLPVLVSRTTSSPLPSCGNNAYAARRPSRESDGLAIERHAS